MELLTTAAQMRRVFRSTFHFVFKLSSGCIVHPLSMRELEFPIRSAATRNPVFKESPKAPQLSPDINLLRRSTTNSVKNGDAKFPTNRYTATIAFINK